MDAVLVYDETLGGVRTAKIRIGTYEAVATCNVKLKHATLQVNGTKPFAPDIQKLASGFVLTYNHTVVMPEKIGEFEDSFKEALHITQTAGPFFDEVLKRMESGERLAPLPGFSSN